LEGKKTMTRAGQGGGKLDAHFVQEGGAAGKTLISKGVREEGQSINIVRGKSGTSIHNLGGKTKREKVNGSSEKY